MRETALRLMRDVGIKRAEEALDLYPHQLSGGMLQRVLIALVLALEPDLIVADEPTTNLDKIVERQILDLFLDLRSRLDAGIIFVTHDMGVAASLCDRIAVMRYGEVLETGPARQIFEDPQHEYTQLLISTAREISDAPAKAAPAADLPPAPALLSLENIDLTFPASGARPSRRCNRFPSISARARSSGWSGNPAPARPRSDGRSCGFMNPLRAG
ncbi:ATP-binding cassette domain-containing protein [Paenirhodobacter populi]|uniref:ATP-binding cassette domain-containing protein n=1 Tax=Paenirhodobacter populi TaxID=2306993 RepID=UPI0013E40D45|nr:ATP-binding cassette domain-containing protein [Sinirhodobacter populi]